MKSSPPTSFLAGVFYPFTAFFSWILSRLSPTIEELEMFENLVETAVRNGGVLLYDRDLGEAGLLSVIDDCDYLIDCLGKKWFPNIEGIKFMRQKLFEIKLRVCAAIGETERIIKCEKQMTQLGVAIPEEVKEQIAYLSMVTRYPFLIKACNFLVKGGAFVIRFLRKRNAGDGTRTRNFRRDRAVL